MFVRDMPATLNLRDSKLFRQQAYIDGCWTDAPCQARFTVLNPADDSVLGHAPDMGAAETEAAIAAAAAAWPQWSARNGKERAGILRRWFDLIVANSDDLAQLVTHEQGKPFAEAQGEVAYGASFVEWFAEEAKRVSGDMPLHPRASDRILVLKQPVGVCAAITPWNFPIAMITRKAAPALAAGCVMIVKPAEQTPFSALALCELAERAGIPRGVLSVVTGDARVIGGTLTASPVVRKLTFTGSTAVGRILMRQSAATIKRMSLELGGNAPLIVLDDADLDATADGAVAAKFRNTGQSCIAANRILVQDSVYDEFARKVAKRAAALVVGKGMEPGVAQGPLIDRHAVEKVEEHVADALSQGASIAIGGKRHHLGGNFFQPTVITNATHTMRLCQEETFGPVAPLVRFASDQDAISMANDTEHGLASYLFGKDLRRLFRMMEALESGMVGVNTGFISNEVAPFGGIKQSGLGREGSVHGIDEYLEMKYVCVGNIGAN